MNFKRVRILFCLLLLAPLVSASPADPGPELQIDILGSFPIPVLASSITGVVSNIGNAPLHNVSYEMTVQGGLLGALNVTYEDTWSEIPAGSSLGVAIIELHGFGPVSITLTASATDVQTMTITAKGIQLGFFTWVPFSWVSLILTE
jgi:energy-converting hydrogenase Eha subunit A